MNFYDQFKKYDDCVPAGVLLPEIKIEKECYEKVGIPDTSTNLEFIKALCTQSFIEKGLDKKDNKKEYIDRCRYEIDILDELSFTDYILLNWDILKWCKVNDIPVGAGRGSAAGSLVLYLLGVTKVDPIEYGLFFERFVSKSRAKKIEKNGVTFLDGSLLADVDNDIAFDRRQEVIDYIKDRHPERSCRILNLMTLGGKICVKEVGKIIGEYSEQEMNEVSSLIPSHFGKTCNFEQAIEENEHFAQWAEENPKIKTIAQKIEGLIKNAGVHASGIAISRQKLTDICPLQKTKEGELVSCYDMKWVAEIMVKFDILGLKTLTVLHDVCDQTGVKLDEIDVRDPSLYVHFQNLENPQGLFQIEADTNLQVCQEIKPRNLDDVSAAVAIARPGALQFKSPYAKYVKTGEFQGQHSFFDGILSYTGGNCLYQEQMMKMAVAVGFTLDEAELLRRIVGKKKVDQMPLWKDKISDKIKENKLDPEIGDILWKIAEDSANYSFNRCLSPDTVVETSIGPMCLFQLSQGDFVKSHDVDNDKDHFVEVLGVHENEVELFEVEMENGSVIKCSMNHKFLCSDKKMRPLKEIISNGHSIVCNETTKVKYYKSIGEQKTLDLEVNHKDHNFYAEDLVVSNSHSISYSVLTMWTLYMKFNHTIEFFAALLRNSKHEQDPFEIVNKISKELNYFEIPFLRPDLAKSKMDFSIEGNGIRYGLNSIKGVSERSLEAIIEFRDSEATNKFDVFVAAKQAKINIGVLSGLIQAGALSSAHNDRAYMVYEAQVFNTLTSREKRNFLILGPQYDYDLFKIWKEEVKEGPNIADDGKPLIKESRINTIKEKCLKYREIYVKNNKNVDFANWFFERKLLGYSYSARLKDIYENSQMRIGIEEISERPQNADFYVIGIITSVSNGRTKVKNEKYCRFSLSDEKGDITCFIWNDMLTRLEYDGISLEKENIVSVRAKRGRTDAITINDLKILDDKIFMKLSDLK